MRFGSPQPGSAGYIRHIINSGSLTVTVDETASLLSVSRDAVYDAVGRGELRAVRVGRQIRIARMPLLEALGVRPEESDSPSDSGIAGGLTR
jgi:excisionase family DNA binding protein